MADRRVVHETHLGVLERAIGEAASDGSVVWEATLITEGSGSSGEYTGELLAASTRAFVAAEDSPEGIATKNFFKHLSWHDDERDPRDQWGFLVESARYEPGVGLKAQIKVLKHWVPVVKNLAAEGQAQLSISAAAAVNEETGEIVAILPHITNSVDMVAHPGRPGSELARKIESARAYRPGTASVSGERENDMDEKQVAALIEAALTTHLAPLTSFVNESKGAKAQEAQAKVDTEALGTARKEAVEAYRAADKLISEAELLEPQIAELRERAANGEDITKAVESAKAIKDAAVKAVTESGNSGVGVANGGSVDEDWSVGL